MASEQKGGGGARGRARPRDLELTRADQAQGLSERLDATPTWGLARPELLELLDSCPEQWSGYEVMTLWYGIAGGRITRDEVLARCPEAMKEIEDLQKDLAEMAALAGEKLTEYSVRAYAAFGAVRDGARASVERMREQLAVAVATLTGPPAEVRLLQGSGMRRPGKRRSLSNPASRSHSWPSRAGRHSTASGLSRGSPVRRSRLSSTARSRRIGPRRDSPNSRGLWSRLPDSWAY
jgi:hypothetical protein